MLYGRIKFFFLLYFSLVSLVGILNAKRSKKEEKTIQNAWIWPGLQKIGIHLTFSETADWSDLWALRSLKGFYTVGKMCVKGAFIVYNEPMYHVKKPDGFEIISGNIRCMRLPETTKSIQLIGSVGNMKWPTITFFEKPSFGSMAYPTVVNVGSDFFQKMEQTRSAIVPWTLQLKSGEKFCIQPDFDPSDKLPICLVKDINLLMESPNVKLVLMRATQGCKKNIDHGSIYKVQDCIYWGKPTALGKLRNFADSSQGKLKGRSGGARPKDHGNNMCGDPEVSKKVFHLYRVAMTANLNIRENTYWKVKVGKVGWKLELLELIFEVATDVTTRVTPNSISHSLLSIIRELFIVRLTEALTKQGIGDSSIPLDEREYLNLIRLTKECTTSNMLQLGKLIDAFTIPWDDITSIADFKDKIDQPFARDSNKDVVTEIVWLIGHMAGYLCHRHFMAISPYWALFFKAFEEIYMKPVASEWKNPTVGLNIILGGIDYELEYQKLAYYTTAARKLANNLEPLMRPL